MSEATALTDSAALREALRTALRVERFVDEVAAAAPYDTVAELLAAARASSTPLAPAEIDEALRAHPRIGERPVGDGAEAAHSRREQGSAPDVDDPDLAARIADGNRRYEARFGRVFLIRAAGRTRAEILVELERRLDLDPETEQRIVGEQLGEIALLRLATTFADTDGPIG